MNIVITDADTVTGGDLSFDVFNRFGTVTVYGLTAPDEVAERIESADIVMMNDDLRSVPAALEIGKATLGNIKQNLFFAFVYNAVCIPIAAGLPVVLGYDGLVDHMPMLSAAAMSLSSISVVSNAMRMKRFRPRALDGDGQR